MRTFSVRTARSAKPWIQDVEKTTAHMMAEGSGIDGFFLYIFLPVGLFTIRLGAGTPTSDSVTKLQLHMRTRGKRPCRPLH
jgi:hypothetical protein